MCNSRVFLASNRLFLFCVLLSLAATGAFTPSHRSRRNSGLLLRFSTTAIPDGIVKQVSSPGSGKAVNLGDIATVRYSCYVSGNGDALPVARADRQKMVVGDGTMVAGWDKALRTMSVGERSIVKVTNPELGYGNEGVPDLIPPGAKLEFDIEILEAQPPMQNIDFDSIAMADNTPRTASDIAAAYEQRQALRAQSGPEKEGFEGWIEKAKNFYFFGFFEGETGQQAPWFLRPSITFPLAFLVVGAAFYVSVISGAISERGAEVTDELDEIIISMAKMIGKSSLNA
ncbi:unnamed protein product [Cylindrotheca closterium]|uniref:peptidylprolyl isomerase n=1 Tax=Cylindrotheca closterium TaxID=2856 RepID=A0AAD2CBG6_9STRA|nr:unnamed protein product [Cylindrotheca closterium]